MIENEGVIYKIFKGYADACVNIQSLINDFENIIPRAPVGIGLIGEYYANFYLKIKNPSVKVDFAPVVQKGWDILVSGENGGKYQVKSISHFNKNGKIEIRKNDFDYLLILIFDSGGFPEKIYKFSINELFVVGNRSRSISIPNYKSRGNRGSAFIAKKNDITEEFWESLEHDYPDIYRLRN